MRTCPNCPPRPRSWTKCRTRAASGGRRYRLGVLLALCAVAVLSGATSPACIARFAADSGPDLRRRLGIAASTPVATTLGRLLYRLDGDALDDAVGAGRSVQRCPPGPREAGAAGPPTAQARRH
ncbi:transposase family protein [Streptomyces sp. JNUCC 63]